MSKKATTSVPYINRMRAEKAHAVKTMKEMAQQHAAVESYQRARIAALEVWVEELTFERDEARRQYCRGLTDFIPNPAHDHLSLEDAAIEVAKSFGWDCFGTEAKP